MHSKIALITGGSRGLGRSAVEHLAARGIDVVLTYRSRADEAEAAVRAAQAQGVRAAALPLEVGAVASFEDFSKRLQSLLREQFGRERFNLLVNNAGMGEYASFADTSEEQFDALMNAHFKGVFFLTQRLLPLMDDGGAILNISSGLARFSLPGYAAYAAMKGAVEVLTRYLALELGPRRIRVNTLAPGAIETDFGGGAVRDNRDLNAMIASQTALGRVGQPTDIGAAMALLLSEDAGWINGQRIEAAGGVHL
jgi:NAD(P)-dependent dehydrogenase (short-subunit alcohol dehydrogenase family)